MIYKSKKNSGFTLIELLVVIAIIGILSSIVIASVNTTREKAAVAKAKSELADVRNVIQNLANDTGVWPNGCAVGSVAGFNGGGVTNEVALTAADAGLLTAPNIVATDPPECDWTAAAVALWNGPYTIAPLIDPWGNSFWFDSDYIPQRDCPTPNANPGVAPIVALVSHGPNGTGGADTDVYDCDDVVVPLVY
jgi:prepilin-type N-terminal cleavage/methylation domain-containing protein